MPAVRKVTANSRSHSNSAVFVKVKSHANDPYVVKKIEQAIVFIQKAGLPKSKK